MADLLQNNFISVSDRLIPKEPMQFFQNKMNNKRVFVSITDKTEIWQKDLVIAERLFSEVIVCPYGDYSNHTIAATITRNVLKERMKYPNVKENPDLLAIAKTWILPERLHMGPDATQFFSMENGAYCMLEPIFQKIETEPAIQYLKIEVAQGLERQLVYSILDSGFRPSLLCIKWSHDLDEHIATAHCAGHLINSGFSLIRQEKDYYLYYFSDQPLYDICSVKNTGLENPFMKAIIDSIICKSDNADIPAKKENSENTVDEGTPEKVN